MKQECLFESRQSDASKKSDDVKGRPLGLLLDVNLSQNHKQLTSLTCLINHEITLSPLVSFRL